MKLLILGIISLFSTSAFCWQYATPIASPVTTTAPVAIQSNTQSQVMGIQLINTAVTPSIVSIQDGSTVIWTGYAPASMGSEIVINFQRPLRALGILNFVANTAGTNIFISAQGISGK